MAEKKTFKKDKFEERVLNELNSLLRTRFTNPRLKSVSITKVEMTPDYTVAKAFWDTYDASTRGDAKKAMESIRSKMRSLLAGVLKVRAVPTLSFEYDGQFDAQQKIEDLLKTEENSGRGKGE